MCHALPFCCLALAVVAGSQAFLEKPGGLASLFTSQEFLERPRTWASLFTSWIHKKLLPIGLYRRYDLG